jgi:hypothetical protein
MGSMSGQPKPQPMQMKTQITPGPQPFSSATGPQPFQKPRNVNQPIGPIRIDNPGPYKGPRNVNQPIGPIPVMPQPEKNPYIPPIISGPIPRPDGGGGPKIDQGKGPNIYNQASGWLDQAATATQNAMHYDPRKLSDVNLNPYMNPFTQSVIDTSMADMNRGRQMAINDNGAAASRAGAFGNSRHGLVEAETNRGFADEVGQLTSGLNKENFYQAQQGAIGDINNDINQNNLRMTGAGQLAGLSGQAFGYGQTLTENQLEQGRQQQALQQQIIDAGRQQWEQSQATPQNSLDKLLQAISGTPYGQTTKNSSQPGWYDLFKNFI